MERMDPNTSHQWKALYEELLKKHEALKAESASWQRSHFLLKKFLENTLDSVYFKDLESRFILVSDAMAKHFGVSSANSMEGKSDFDFFGKDHAAQAFSDEQAIIKTGTPLLDYEEKEDFSSNEVSWVSTSKFPLISDEGKIIGTFGISRNITELKFAQQSALAKERFLANMSHEIRTPLNGIMGMTRQLAKTNLETAQQEYLNIIYMSSQNLMVILNDILDLAKLHSQKLRLEEIGFNLTKIIKSVIRNFEDEGLKKGIELLYQIDENIEPVLIGDPVRLYQIIMNLVSNAVKFTDTGYVRVDCELKSIAGKDCEIEFRVEDTGVGIKDTEIIFEVFEQESKTVFRKFGGSGLGLAICKELVDLYKGQIKVDSKIGQGSIFTVTLPFTIGKDIELTEDIPTTELEQSSLAGKKVLLAEDNEINQYVIESILKDWKMIISMVHNGEEAIHKMASEKFDIVLMDIKMPVINGLEATTYIRKELHNEIPIIALTANSLSVEIDKTKAAGMSDFVSKPIDPTLLYSKMLHHLGIVTNTKKSVEQEMIKRDQEDSLYDLSTIKELARGSEDFISTTITLFLEKTPPILDAIKHALDENDIDQIKSQAHKLKSTANLFKMTKVIEVVDKLENVSQGESTTSLAPDVLYLQDLMSQANILLDRELNSYR